MISAPLDPDPATQPSPPPGDGSGVASAPTPETQQSVLPPRNQRPRDGLRKRTTGRSDHIFCLILHYGLTLYCFSFLVIRSPSVISSTLSHPLTLAQVLEPMSPVRLSFFDKLNAELSKVESFFIEREGEGRKRTLQLKEQLEELKDHRRLFHVIGCFVLYCMPYTEGYS
jgi:SPX domain